MKKKRLVFDYIKKKYHKNLRKLVVLNFLLLALVISSLFTVMMSVGNITSNILDNEKLSMVLINGYTEDNGEYEYDIERIEQMPHVKDVVYEYVTVILLEIDGEPDFIDCHSWNETTREAVDYDGEMDERSIILPENLQGKELSFYTMDYEELDINEYYYEGNGHFFLKNYCYATQDLYDELAGLIKMEENYSGVKNLIVNLEKMEHVFDFVTAFHDMFDEDEAFVYYQAEGLENLVVDSKTSLLLLVLFEIILFIVILIIYRGSLSSFIKVLNRDMISLYLNGMSSKQIVQQFYRTIEKANRIIYVLSLLFILLIGGWLYLKVNLSILMGWMAVILVALVGLVLLNKLFIRYLISRLLKKELSSDSIVSKLRN